MKISEPDSDRTARHDSSDEVLFSVELPQDKLTLTKRTLKASDEDPLKASDEVRGSYSASTVIMLYLFFGGPIGGGLIGLAIVLGTGELGAILFIPIGMIFGVVLGLIPATLTGILAVYFKLTSDSKGLIGVSLIGAITTALYVLGYMVIGNHLSSFASTIAVIIESAIFGSVCGLLTGWLFLPKSDRHHNLAVGSI